MSFKIGGVFDGVGLMRIGLDFCLMYNVGFDIIFLICLLVFLLGDLLVGL